MIILYFLILIFGIILLAIFLLAKGTIALIVGMPEFMRLWPLAGIISVAAGILGIRYYWHDKNK